MVQVVGKDTSVVKRVTCRNCSSVLEYVPGEVKSRSGKDYSGGPDGKEWIDCPCCGKEVTLKSW